MHACGSDIDRLTYKKSFPLDSQIIVLYGWLTFYESIFKEKP